MEVQLFDGEGRFIFRIKLSEKIWPTVRHAFQDMSITLDGEPTANWDCEFAPNVTAGLLRDLEGILLQYRDRALARKRVGNFGEVTETILGENLWIDPRHPEDQELQRLNLLFVALRDTIESDQRVHLFTMPHLGSIEHRLAWLLRENPQGVLEPDIAALLFRSFQQLQDATTNEHIKSSLRRDAEKITDTLEQSIRLLISWQLAHHSQIGALQATKKLEVVLI
ncbi:hypothetical protein ABZ725_07855 [Streptomyces sp. NPDC006872]|uniref:hypothetical protein n=1 Tax=Streptomyces sp. NPDC006872 TaxID=3155720 RepID=UPI0033EE4E26